MKIFKSILVSVYLLVITASSFAESSIPYRSPIRDIQLKSTSLTKEQSFYQSLKKSVDVCMSREGVGSRYRCYVDSFPKKCEEIAEDMFTKNSFENKKRHFNCVSTCVDASWFDTKFGECSRTEYK